MAEGRKRWEEIERTKAITNKNTNMLVWGFGNASRIETINER